MRRALLLSLLSFGSLTLLACDGAVEFTNEEATTDPDAQDDTGEDTPDLLADLEPDAPRPDAPDLNPDPDLPDGEPGDLVPDAPPQEGLNGAAMADVVLLPMVQQGCTEAGTCHYNGSGAFNQFKPYLPPLDPTQIEGNLALFAARTNPSNPKASLFLIRAQDQHQGRMFTPEQYTAICNWIDDADLEDNDPCTP